MSDHTDLLTTGFKCPHCAQELQLPENAWYYTCDNCQERLDLKSQFAYLRGLDAFDAGQDIIQKLNPKKKKALTRYNGTYADALALFMKAYSSLQVAFQARLGEIQRQVGVEMMASMTAEFMRQDMVSGMEVSYWNTLMIEQTTQNEYDTIKQKLGTNLNFFMRLRWQSRLKQLEKSFPEIDRKIQALERQIAFIEIPHARNKKWKM